MNLKNDEQNQKIRKQGIKNQPKLFYQKIYKQKCI